MLLSMKYFFIAAYFIVAWFFPPRDWPTSTKTWWISSLHRWYTVPSLSQFQTHMPSLYEIPMLARSLEVIIRHMDVLLFHIKFLKSLPLDYRLIVLLTVRTTSNVLCSPTPSNFLSFGGNQAASESKSGSWWFHDPHCHLIKSGRVEFLAWYVRTISPTPDLTGAQVIFLACMRVR